MSFQPDQISYLIIIDSLINDYNSNIDDKHQDNQLENEILNYYLVGPDGFIINNEISTFQGNAFHQKYIEVSTFFTYLLNDFNQLNLSERTKFVLISEFIKYVFNLDTNSSLATNPRIDDLTFENLSQIANYIIFAIYKKLIDPLIGSTLIAEVWPLVSYDSRLNKFIGRETETQDIINELKECQNQEQQEKLRLKIIKEKEKLIREAENFITIETR